MYLDLLNKEMDSVQRLTKTFERRSTKQIYQRAEVYKRPFWS